jgi:hypothetical protein
MKTWQKVALLTVGAAFVSRVEAQTTLRFKFKEGDTVEYAIDHKQTFQRTSGKQEKLEFSLNMVVSQQVVGSDQNSSGKVRLVVDRAKIVSIDDLLVGSIEVDSTGRTTVVPKESKWVTDGFASCFREIIRGMTGAEFAFVMDGRGEIRDVRVPDELNSRFQIGFGEIPRDFFSKEGLKKLVKGPLIFSVEPVREGQSWTQQNSINIWLPHNGGEMAFTYQGRHRGTQLESVTFEPTMSVGILPRLILSTRILKQNGTGRILFDNDTGRLVELRQTLEATIEADGTKSLFKREEGIRLVR